MRLHFHGKGMENLAVFHDKIFHFYCGHLFPQKNEIKFSWFLEKPFPMGLEIFFPVERKISTESIFHRPTQVCTSSIKIKMVKIPLLKQQKRVSFFFSSIFFPKIHCLPPKPIAPSHFVPFTNVGKMLNPIEFQVFSKKINC